MNKLLASAVLLSAAVLTRPAVADDVFAGDGRVFSGVASDSGEGLILPQTLVSGGITGFSSTFETGFGAPVAMVAVVGGGLQGEGLAAFPAVEASEFNMQARLTMGDVGWGLTPYFGVGVTQASSDNRIFQGIPTLLPFEAEVMGMQGVAGIAYQLMPGVGAGLEYRYQGFSAATPVARDASDNQTIMMRLDLGLN
ncbi:MAG: hypothetical protein QM698_03865 [Micropepsaceae bacterium]